MTLKELIEAGAEKAGSLSALARYLELNQPDLSNAKNGKRGLPLEAACKLADYINAPLRAVLAANQLATEKKEEKRTFWETWGKAATLAAFAVCVNFVTPSPAEAAPSLSQSDGCFVLC